MHIQWKWTVPNVLSLLRIALLPVFILLYLNDHVLWACIVLILSGLTDALDGAIARRFNQISDVGKLLDPLADKLTQVAMIICLATRDWRLWILLGVCIVKEFCQILGGILLLKHGDNVRGSQWFGRVYTATFYVVMGTFVFTRLIGWEMPIALSTLLIAIVMLMMIYTLCSYFCTYVRVRKKLKVPAETEQNR